MHTWLGAGGVGSPCSLDYMILLPQLSGIAAMPHSWLKPSTFFLFMVFESPSKGSSLGTRAGLRASGRREPTGLLS